MRVTGIFDLDELHDLEKNPHEKPNWIDDAVSYEIREEMRWELARLLRELGGTLVPSFRVSHAGNVRNPASGLR